ncbi:MAG: transposase [Planctomycetes bacterium]|nr:transposase [Planctomycetota bacterium]
MWKWLKVILGALRSSVRNQRDLALENLALRQQLATLKFRGPRPNLTDSDRLFWVVLSRFWSKWVSVVHVVQPATVIRWHRQGFRYYWRWKSRPRGRPRIDSETRQLVRKMSLANALWGAPRIHGELLKLGIDISEATVSKYLVRHCGPPSQDWRAFLQNHFKELISLDFLTVPTASFKVLFVLVILSNERRRILHFNVTDHPTATWTAQQLVEACGMDDKVKYLIRDRDAIYGKIFSRRARALGIEEVVTAYRSPWQNPYAERVIGSIRRECLDHIIVLGPRHLKRVLTQYVDYYNGVRTHLSLRKDSPDRRPIQFSSEGRIIELKKVGGLHHHYMREAA